MGFIGAASDANFAAPGAGDGAAGMHGLEPLPLAFVGDAHQGAMLGAIQKAAIRSWQISSSLAPMARAMSGTQGSGLAAPSCLAFAMGEDGRLEDALELLHREGPPDEGIDPGLRDARFKA